MDYMGIKNDIAKPLGTVPLDWITLPPGINDWEKYETDDIFSTNFINIPKEHLFTLGSAIHLPNNQTFASLATTPAFKLPTSSQYYVAGRTVVRWGGEEDPLELDFDHYGFTPDRNKGLALVWLAPKSEPHHLSEMPEMLNHIPSSMKQLVDAITKGEFK